MRRAFLEFLVRQEAVPPHYVQAVQDLLRSVPEPIGAIALNYGLLQCEDIDNILDEQRETRLPFGEIAVRRRLLTREQVETLLCVQRVRAAAEVAEALTLSGLCPANEIITQLGNFLASLAPQPACPRI